MCVYRWGGGAQEHLMKKLMAPCYNENELYNLPEWENIHISINQITIFPFFITFNEVQYPNSPDLSDGGYPLWRVLGGWVYTHRGIYVT